MYFARPEAADEHHDEGDERADQPLAQLDQVIHQRRAGGLDLVLVRRRHALLSAGADVARGAARRAAGARGGSRQGEVEGRLAAAAAPGAGDAALLGGRRLGAAGRGDGLGDAAIEAPEIGSKAVFSELTSLPIELTSSFSPQTCFLTSSSSASRIASLNWLWNSPAILRTLAVMLPERAQGLRQILRADDDERDGADHQHLAPAHVEHGPDLEPSRTGAGRPAASRPCARPGGAVGVDAGSTRRSAEPARGCAATGAG